MITTSKNYYPEGYQCLAKTLINFTINDYYNHVNKYDKESDKIVNSCIRFFQSDAFLVWADVAQICIDPDKFIQHLYNGSLKEGI